CYNDLEFPLIIRYRKNGDTMDLGIGNKKVSRILIDKKVPKDNRSNIPVVINGDGKILWLVNYQKSDFVAKMKDKGDIYLLCEVVK
ncbi:MAG: tRNA lysidine(34) synthetase TilS, partial [Acholeplasmatales bacterium]|nr:tRNA lysidine(34) synthetase TilS [Acholeplasmatales bacterium]